MGHTKSGGHVWVAALSIAALSQALAGSALSAQGVVLEAGTEAWADVGPSTTWLLAGAVAGAATLFMMDDDLRDLLRDPLLQQSGTADFVASSVSHLGGWAPVAVAGGVFVIGTLAGTESIADPAIHTAGGLLAATVVTTAIKGVFGRARPRAAEDPVHEFGLGRGFREAGHPFRSFPSGHTTAAFAMAAVLSAESAHRWPRAHPYVKWSAYSLATLTGLSRMYHNQHWASDVFLGAGIGVVVGKAFVRWRHKPDVGGLMNGLTVSPGPKRSLALRLQLPKG